MGLFSFVGDIFGGSSTTVNTVQKASQDIKVNVNPAIDVGVNVDTTPIGREVGKALDASTDRLAASNVQVGKAIGEGLTYLGASTQAAQLSLTSAAERQTQTEAERLMQDAQQFALFSEGTKKAGALALAIAGIVIFIWVIK